MDINKYVFTSGIYNGETFENIYKVNKKYMEWWWKNKFGYNNKTQNLIIEFLGAQNDVTKKEKKSCCYCLTELEVYEQIKNDCSLCNAAYFCCDCFFIWRSSSTNKCVICRIPYKENILINLLEYVSRTKMIYEKIKHIFVIIFNWNNWIEMLNSICDELKKQPELLFLIKLSVEKYFFSGIYICVGKLKQNKTTYYFNKFKYLFDVAHNNKQKKFKFTDVKNILENLNNWTFLNAYYVILYIFYENLKRF